MSSVFCLLASVLAAIFGGPWKPQDDFRPNAAARMPSAEAARFLKAAPVWPAGQESAENALFGFRADFVAGKGDRPVLRIAATTFYRVYVNGVFVGHGPVRAAHGFFRTDEWPLDAVVREGRNAVAVDVRRYGMRTQNCAGLQPGFLLAEVAAGERVLAATGRDFTCVRLPLLPNAGRFTPQRAPIEVYRLASDWRDYRTRPGFRGAPPARRPDVKLLPRLSPYPGFDVVRPRTYAASAFSYDAAAPRKRPELCMDGREELGRVRNVTVTPADASGAAGVGRGTQGGLSPV